MSEELLKGALIRLHTSTDIVQQSVLECKLIWLDQGIIIQNLLKGKLQFFRCYQSPSNHVCVCDAHLLMASGKTSITYCT